MACARKLESFVWTDNEVELLLRLTLDYKTSKLQENVDWESCQSKYIDLTNAFRAQYPRESTEDFPHEAVALSRIKVTTKLKNIRVKYRRAVDTGRRSGQGRVVLLFYELCRQIWGGSPATRPIDSSIETDDLVESSSQPSTPTEEMPASPNSTESHERLPPAVVKQRRDLLQAKLGSHRGDRLKRKAPADPVDEDLKIKRRMLELAEESARSYSKNMAQINTNIANIISTIQDGFSLMRGLLLRPQFVHPHSSSGQVHSHEKSSKLLNSPVSCRQDAAARVSPEDPPASGRYALARNMESVETSELSAPGANGNFDEDIYVPTIQQRSVSSELLLKCEEEELEPCQNQTYMKEEDEDWSVTHQVVEELVCGKDQTGCKPDLSLLQGNAMSSSPPEVKKEMPQSVVMMSLE